MRKDERIKKFVPKSIYQSVSILMPPLKKGQARRVCSYIISQKVGFD